MDENDSHGGYSTVCRETVDKHRNIFHHLTLKTGVSFLASIVSGGLGLNAPLLECTSSLVLTFLRKLGFGLVKFRLS